VAAKRALMMAGAMNRPVAGMPTGPSSMTYAPMGSGVGSWVNQSHSNDANAAALQGYYAQRADAGRLAMMTPTARAAAMGGGGYFPVGSGGGSLGQLSAAYQQALDKANAANENRYQDTLQGSQARLERNMGYLENSGQQQAKDINQAYDKQLADTNQDLINRGLRASTITGNMGLQNQVERQNALGRMQDQLRQQRVATDSALSGDTLQLMASKNDIAPDMNQLIALAQMLGQGGGGGGAVMLPPVMAGGGGMGGGGYGYSPVGMGYGGMPMVGGMAPQGNRNIQNIPGLADKLRRIVGNRERYDMLNGTNMSGSYNQPDPEEWRFAGG
jgi:hypothetical protein